MEDTLLEAAVLNGEYGTFAKLVFIGLIHVFGTVEVVYSTVTGFVKGSSLKPYFRVLTTDDKRTINDLRGFIPVLSKVANRTVAPLSSSVNPLPSSAYRLSFS